jgi:hypothetical protein
MNPRIHEIIGTLQLLNEELQHNQGSGEVLGKIKLFSAQLYLESDMELIAVGREANTIENIEPEFSDPVPSTMDHVPGTIDPVPSTIDHVPGTIDPVPSTIDHVPSTIDPVPSTIDPVPSTIDHVPSTIDHVPDNIDPVPSTIDHVPGTIDPVPSTMDHVPGTIVEDLQNSQPSLFGFEPEMEDELVIEEEETPVFEAPKSSGIELIIKKQELESVDNEENATSSVPASKEITPDAIKQANEVLSMFSLSRRFEFANFLFGGDMQKFTTFICEMILAQPGDEREDVFESWYERFDWKRRDESASDLKRNLRKMM